MSHEFLVGFIVGAVVFVPLVFMLTAMGAHKVWRCVPCTNGEPVFRNGNPVKEPNSVEYRGF